MLRPAVFLSPLLVLLVVSSVFAVRPSEWVHHTEADFSAGETNGIVVTNLGEVRLAQDARLLASVDEDALVYDLAQLDDGRIFVALGPEAKLAELVDESLEEVERFAGSQIFSLTTDGESLWVGISGANSRIERWHGEELEAVQTIELDEARYVWDLVLANDRLYAATGTEGKLYVIDYDRDEAVVETALDTRPSNILALAADGQGRIYAGTDGDGLIYRLTRRDNGSYESFVLYDAPEPEIGALLVMEDGTVYAGTADADQARPGRLEAARDETRGRPETVPTPNGQPADPPVLPEPAPEPEPEPAADPAEEADEADAEPVAEEPAEEADAPAESVAEADAPTPEQYEALRQIVSERLSEARSSGRVPTQTAPSAAAQTQGTARTTTTARPPAGRQASRQGNAIYRITPEGFVHEIFRESVMVLDILEQNGALLVATGNEGQLYRLDPSSEEVVILSRMDAQQVPSLFKTNGGSVLLGTANPGLLFELGSGYVSEGTLTSRPLDAQQISLWGKLMVEAANVDGASVEVRTRSGNVSDPEMGNWSDWSEPERIQLTGGRSSYLDVQSPSARFLQYEVRLRAGEDDASPTVYRMALRYMVPNLPPRISTVKSEYTQGRNRPTNPNDAPQQQTTLKVEWEASDPNDDRLSFTVAARPFGEDGPFVTVAENVNGNSYDWDTRTVPDGRYVLRITASDAADNIPGEAMTATRRSDPVTIDNSPPTVHDFEVEAGENGEIVFTARVVDELTPVREVRYRVSGSDDWHLVLPEDMIYDSTEESFRVTIPDLAPGTKVLSLRATDAQGNTRYVSRTFSVPR